MKIQIEAIQPDWTGLLQLLLNLRLNDPTTPKN
jgi:hypothetical protein